MCDRCPKEGKDGIAEELGDKAIIARDRFTKRLKQRVLKFPHLLRIKALGQRGKSGEVSKEDSHMPAIHLPVRCIRSRGRKSFRQLARGWGNADGHPFSLTKVGPGRAGYPDGPAPRTECEIRLAEKAARHAGGWLLAAAPRTEGET